MLIISYYIIFSLLTVITQFILHLEVEVFLFISSINCDSFVKTGVILKKTGVIWAKTGVIWPILGQNGARKTT